MTTGGDTPGSAGGPTVLRMLLGAHLRRLREAQGVSREDAGWEITRFDQDAIPVAGVPGLPEIPVWVVEATATSRGAGSGRQGLRRLPGTDPAA